MSSFRRGWLDYQRGMGWAAVYETWKPTQQLNYERGRRAAAIAMYHRGDNPAPNWTAFKASMPRALRVAAMREVR